MGTSNFTATLFGKPDNWSLSQLSDPAKKQEFGKRLGAALYALRVGKALAPSPVKFTDHVIDSKYLTAEVQAGNYVVYRNPDMPADGVPLRRGEAYLVSPAGCPTTLMTRGADALALHTGRFCLIDRLRLEGKYRPDLRPHGSICFAGLDYLHAYDKKAAEEVSVKIFWSIPGPLFVHDLNDKKYADINKMMYNELADYYGSECVPRQDNRFYPDLPKIVRAQCMKRGVLEENIDLKHAYLPKHDVWVDGTPGTPRNAMVLVRHS